MAIQSCDISVQVLSDHFRCRSMIIKDHIEHLLAVAANCSSVDIVTGRKASENIFRVGSSQNQQPRRFYAVDVHWLPLRWLITMRVCFLLSLYFVCATVQRLPKRGGIVLRSLRPLLAGQSVNR